jgi:hypothetical protein
MTDNNGWPGKPGVPLNPERWRGAINDALTNWLSPIEDHETPADALQRLIRLEVNAAIDPKVSQSAADLVASARKDALEEAARVADGYHQRAIAWAYTVRGLEKHIDATDSSRIAAAIRALAKGEGNE